MSTVAEMTQRIAALRAALEEKTLREELAALEAQLAAPAKAPRAPKEGKKATTNATGPAAFNLLVRSTWIEMASKLGVSYTDLVRLDGVDQSDKTAMTKAEAAWKKAAGAAGATYQAAMKEAGNRQRAAAGKETLEAAKAAKAAKAAPAASAPVAAAVPAPVAAPAPAPPAPAPPAPVAEAEAEAEETEEVDEAAMLAEFETHHQKLEYEGKEYYCGIQDGEVLEIAGFCQLGKHVGQYDPDTEEIDFSA
jgi:hypothetical protein